MTGHVAATIVGAVDPEGVEDPSQLRDLAEEVGCREASFAKRIRWSVARRGDARARVHELAEEARHDHRVAWVVELELVNRDEARALEGADGLRVAEGADEGRVLDKRAEVFPPRVRVPDGGEQVRLADSESAIEVDAWLDGRGLLAEAEEPLAPGARSGFYPGEAFPASTAAACEGYSGSGR